MINHAAICKTVDEIAKALETIEKPNAHENDAKIRCVTLKRCLSQAAQVREAEANAIAAADKQVEAALANKPE